MKLEVRYLAWVVLSLCIFSLSACVAIQTRNLDKVGRAAQTLVFPPPPDEPRFVYERAIRGSTDVVPESEQSAMKRVLTGTSDERAERMAKPYAVVVQKGRIFVSDTVASQVKIFDVASQSYAVVGEDDKESHVAKPLGIDVDGAGNLYIADGVQKQIVVFDAKGRYQRKIGGPKWFDRLSSVTVSDSGDRLYVVDIGGVSSQQHRVRVFDGRSGEHLFDIGKRGTGPGEFNLPRDVALGKEGRIYVVDGGNFRVQIFDKDGKFLKTFGAVGKQLGNFARPKEIATDREGNVYVIDTAFGNFQIFNAEGDLLMFIGNRTEQDVPAGYMLPSGIAVDEDGRIYVVDQWFKRIDVFRPYSLKESEGYLGMRKAVAKPSK